MRTAPFARAASGLLAAVLSLLLVAAVEQPAVATEAAPASPDCLAAEHGLTAPDQPAALGLAAECDEPVEIDAWRTPTQRQFAQPDGSVTLQSYVRPQWARGAGGEWRDVDPSLVSDGVGGFTTAATVVEIEVSGGGAGPLARVSDGAGRWLSLTWPEVLPQPLIEGATATYPEVYDGVDLRVTAGVDWLSYLLVVHSAEAAAAADLASVGVRVAAGGLEIAQAPSGAVVARDLDDGAVVFSAPGAAMWDASIAAQSPSGAALTALAEANPQWQMPQGGDLPGAEPGRLVQLAVELDGDVVRVVPDQAMLADPATEFPVTIDPTFAASRLAWVNVGDEAYVDETWWDDAVWPRVDGLRVGYLGWIPPSELGYGTWRSIARFDTSATAGSSVNSAQVDVTVYHTGGCDSQPLQLWQVEAISQGAVPTSWNSTAASWLNGGPLQTRTVPSANSTGVFCSPNPDRAVVFDNNAVRDAVRRQADQRHESVSFGLRAADESDMMQWMRAYTESLVLTVNYTPVVAVPSELTVGGVGCLAPEGSRVVGSTPVLAGVPRNSEGTVLGEFELRAAGGSQALQSWTSPVVPSGEPLLWQVDSPLPEGTYQWRMRSEHPDTAELSAWSGWCEFRVDSLLDVEPPPQSDELLECPVPVPGDGSPLEAADEGSALLLAAVCEADAEAVSERDFATRVLARPDGDLVAEQFTVPQWAPDADGEWTELDTGFTTDGEGRVVTAAAVSEIEVSPGGSSQPLVTATDPDGGSVALWWPEPLPAPVIDGDTVTYPEVFDDVDLQVTAGADGFSYVLVVKTAQAAASPELASVSVGISAGGGLDLLQDPDGAVLVRDGAGEVVFSSPAAYMWDSSEPDPEPDPESGVLSDPEGSGDPEPTPGRVAQMPLELDSGTLTVAPDQELLSDPEVEFPVMIDPPFTGRHTHWASVHQQQPSFGWTDDSQWPRRGGMRVGRLGDWPNSEPCGNACGLWRSAVRFNINRLSGRQIVSASVKLTQTHTSGCGSYGLQLWHVSSITSGVTWNQMQSRWQSQLQSQTVASSNSGGCGGALPNRGVTFGASAVRNRVQTSANAGHSQLSFGLRSSNESGIEPYRRIAAGSLALEVVYNRPAQTPTNLSTDGRGCATSAPGPWLTTQRPTLSGVPRDPDGRVGAHLQIRRIGSSSTFYSWQTARNRTHNQVVNHRIPSSQRLPSGEYRWRMRSLDNLASAGASDWRQWCHFRVDVTAPTTPTVEVVGDPPNAGEPVTLRFHSSDAHSGLAGFDYGINEEVRRHNLSASSSGTAEVTFTASELGGRMWVYVWSRDNAGNLSNRAVFDFFAARFVEATPQAAWRLDGDAVDDSGHGHELMFGGGGEWEPDAGPPADRSLGFDGTGCVATAGPVVRLDAEYTIAAWVRLDDNTNRQTMLGAAGHRRLGFYLRYREGTDRWQFLIGNDDTPDVTFASLFSAEAPTVGQWTHIAVRVDPAARHMQLYIDGELSNERDIPWATWHAPGPLYVGCSARVNGHTWDHFGGAIHHVGVWQGLLTPAQIEAAYEGELPAGLTGDWRLRSDGADGSDHVRDLAVPLGVGFVDDQYGRQRSAAQLDGATAVEAAGRIVATDQSFSVAGWAKLDHKGDVQTVVSQGGEHVPGFQLGYDPGDDRWQLSMPSHDAASAVVWHTVQSSAAPVTGQWYHLAGAFDRAAGEFRLYVDGEPQGASAGPAQPWQADDALLIGAAGTAAGPRSDHLTGTVSDVKVWRGALTDEQVADVHGGNPAVEWLSQWRLNGNGGDDRGNHPLTFSGTEGVDYEWVEDQECFPFSALGLGGSGAGHARTAAPVVTTDESFTVTAWVKLHSVTGSDQTVLSQGGQARSAFYLQATPDGAWRFAMPQQDSASPDWIAAESPTGSVEVGEWTHLAGVFDLPAGELRLYVQGELVDVADGVESPWHGGGPFYLGVAGTAGGSVSDQLHGAIDRVTAWSSTVHDDRIWDLSRGSSFGFCF